MSGEPVVVTGVGALTPLGTGVPALVERLWAGEVSDGRCSGFEERLSRKQLKRAARHAHLALVAAAEAFESAGWTGGVPYDDVLCVIGVGLGGIETYAYPTSPLTVPLLLPNGATAAICLAHELHGESYAIAGACAAGTQAIGAGYRAIQRGEVRAAVVGGAEASTTPEVVESFVASGALSPTGVCRPFDAHRDGLTMGEGAGILILEAESSARARGARVLGRVTGYGSTSDAHHITAPAPDGVQQARAVSKALADAGDPPIAYINAHGTGTPLNDATETGALARVLDLPSIPISSIKGATGHLFAAGGAVEAIATLHALTTGTPPPTANLTAPDPDLGSLHHADPATRLAPGAALSPSFGFGGHNAVLVLAAP